MAETTPTRRALLIGIDAYALQPDVIRPLQGCVNDVRGMERILRAPPYAFEDVRVLTNEQATRDGILAALDRLVEDVATDDLVVIQYAGHGSQKWNAAGDEASGWDSTIVPVDSGRKPVPNRDITDEEIHARLEALGRKTPYTTLFFDSCHSGTITRDVFEARSRGVAPDAPEGAATRSVGPARTRGVGKRGAESGEVGSRYVVISGCRDEETSWEYRAPAEEGGTSHGALSYFLMRELVKPGRKSYRDVFEAIAPVVTAYKGQHPQIEGRADAEVLGVGMIPPMEYVRVTGPSSNGKDLDASGVVELAAGAAHRVTVGSEYDVFRPGTSRPADEERVGRVRVTAVHAVHALAEPLGGTTVDAIEVGARAVETKHAYGDMRLRVFLDESVGDAGDALRTLLASSTKVQLVDDVTQAQVRAAIVRPGAAGAVSRAIDIGEPRWAMVDGRGELVGPLKGLADVEQFAKNLDTYAGYRDTLTLENPDQASALRGTVTLELLRRVSDATQPKGWRWEVARPAAPNEPIVFEEEDFVAFRITNHHTKPVFVNLLDLSVDGEIAVLYPRPEHQVEPVGTERAFNVWKKSGDGYRILFPDTIPFHPGDAAESFDVIKLFVTTREARFEGIQQAAMRSVTERSAVEALMRDAAGGRKVDLSDDEEEAATPDTEDWTTVQVRFVTRRKGAGGAAALAVQEASQASQASQNAAATAASLPGGLAAALGISSAARDAAERAIAGAGLGVQQSFEVVQQPVAPGQRAAGRSVEVAAPPEGFGQMVLTTDADGVVSWHFAEAAPDGTRGTGATRSYAIPAPVGATAGAPGERSILTVGMRKLVEVVVFPIVAEYVGAAGVSALEWWEGRNRAYGLRTFTPDDYASPDGTPVDGATLANGRALLMVHGTFSRANSAFGALPKSVVEQLHAMYGGRVFAFDHFSLSHDPERNVQWLLDRLPAGATLDVDIVCHSRGGLVSRVMAERHADRIRVGKVVFVGAPNAGTTLADVDHVSTFIDTYTNLLAVVPPTGVGDVLEGIVEVAKMLAVGVARALPGLQAMQPKGEFLAKTLNVAGPGATPRYYSLSSNYTPASTRPGLKALLTNRLMDKVFAADNDLVVPTESTFAKNGSPLFPIADARVFRGEESMTHTEFFGREAVHGQILTWLGA